MLWMAVPLGSGWSMASRYADAVINKISHFMRFCATFILVVSIGVKPCTAAPVTDELQTLTAAFLFNFMKLSEWPPEAISDQFTLCVSESTEYASKLDSIAGKEVQNKPVIIKHLLPGEDASICQLLFLPDEEKPLRRQEWLKHIDNKPILSVSDVSEFLDEGGMIVLVADNSHLKFEVNLAKVEKAGIKMSSQILQIARQVREK